MKNRPSNRRPLPFCSTAGLSSKPTTLHSRFYHRAPFLTHAGFAIAALSGLMFGQTAHADALYWTGIGTTWDLNTDWSTSSTATNTNPIAPPGSADDAYFNVSSVSTNQSLTLGSSDAVNSLNFMSTPTTTFSSGSLTVGSGGITLNAGAGNVSYNAGIVIGGSETWTNNSTSSLVFNNSGGAISVANTASPITLTIAGTGSISVKNANSFTDSAGGGIFSLVIANGGNLTINPGANSYTGGTTIKSGSIRSQSVSGLGSGMITLGDTTGSATAFLNFVNGGTVANAITVQGSGASTISIGGTGNTDTYSNTITLNNSTPLTLTTTASSGATPTLIFNGLMTGTGGLAMTKNGSNLGNLNVAINHANSYSGGTTVNYGTLTVQNSAALGDSGAALNLAGGTVDFATDSTVNTYNVTVTGNTTINSDKATSGSGGITHALGTLTLSANTLNIAAGTNVSGGAPMISFGAAALSSTTGATSTLNPTTAGVTLTTVVGSANATKTDTLTLGGSATTNSITSSIGDGANGGQLALMLNSTGTWTLTGGNTYSGPTTLTNGALNVNNPAALGAPTSTINLNGGTIDNTNGGVTLSNNNPITLGGNFAFGGTNSVNLGMGAITNGGNRTVTLNGNASTLTLGGTMTNTSNAVQTTTVNGVGNTLALGGYALSNNATSRIDVITGTGNVTISGAVTNGGTSTASGLTYSGTGVLTLAGTNTYGGATTIKSGAVVVTGSLSANSAVTVGDLANPSVTATLAGRGTVGNVTVGEVVGNVGASVNPSNGIPELAITGGSTLSTGNFTIGSGSGATVALQIGRIAPGDSFENDGSDRILAGGAVSLDGNLQLTLQSGYAPQVNDVLYLIVHSGSASTIGLFASVNGTALSGSTFSFDNFTWQITTTASASGRSFTGGNDVAIQAITAVPEPSTWASMLGGLGILLYTRRQRRPQR